MLPVEQKDLTILRCSQVRSITGFQPIRSTFCISYHYHRGRDHFFPLYDLPVSVALSVAPFSERQSDILCFEKNHQHSDNGKQRGQNGWRGQLSTGLQVAHGML